MSNNINFFKNLDFIIYFKIPLRTVGNSGGKKKKKHFIFFQQKEIWKSLLVSNESNILYNRPVYRKKRKHFRPISLKTAQIVPEIAGAF